MPQLHLPARHTDADLALAGSLAQVLRSGELYVAWSTDGGAAKPVIPATVYATQTTERPAVHNDTPLPQPTVEVPALALEPPVRAERPVPPAAPRRRGLLQRLRARRARRHG